MTEKIIIRHLSGSKINQVEEFDIAKLESLTFGRDDKSNISYDADKDDLVSRRHAVIKQQETNRFSITDENSRNGTFVNKQRISGEFVISHGDIIQFGAGGPEFQFELDPPPKVAPPPTREASDYFHSKQTRFAEVEPDLGEQQSAPQQEQTSAISSPGRVTKLQQGLDAYQKQSRQTQLSIGAALLGILILVSGLIFFLNTKNAEQTQDQINSLTQTVTNSEQQAAAIKSPKQIAADNIEAVVMITQDWKLTHIESNKQVYHKVINGHPCYIFHNGKTFPWLTIEGDENGTNVPVGGAHSGTGFVVERNGFILTNRHVAASETLEWSVDAPYLLQPSYVFNTTDLGNSSYAYMAVDIDKPHEFKDQRLVSMLSELRWIPAEETVLIKAQVIIEKKKQKTIYVIDAKQNQYTSRDSLNVFFPNSNNPTPAKLVRKSITHDVALIKIAAMQGLPAVQLEEDNIEPEIGEEITILGYPGVSPDVVVMTKSANPFHQDPSFVKVSYPTLTTGNIGKRISDKSVSFDASIQQVFSRIGDVYQLTANATGSGNSGGPVFNPHGRVIGIFFAGIAKGGATITFAIPISYGREIMRGYQQ